MAHRTRLAELDRRFSIERDLLEQMLFKLAVVRSMRLVSADPSDLIEAHRHFEVAAAAIRQPGPAAENEMLDGLPDRLEVLAETAPEPFRTMFADHLERLTAIAVELADPSLPRSSADPLDRQLEDVLCRAVRAAVSGTAAPELSSFVRAGIRELRPRGA